MENLPDIVKLKSEAEEKNICEHVYRNMNANPCPKCGKETHEIDWKYQNKLHEAWIAEGKAVYGGWWSI